jgi:4-amino-4-deoxy-L-arabinose transferase-like glycosyltransferase
MTRETRNEAPTAWLWLIAVAAARFIAHLVTNGNYGVFRDEFYYLACADHLAWGYVDQPPFSIAVLAAWKGVFGDSVHSIRILPALVGSGIVVMSGVIARDLGGGRFAQILTALVTALVPTYLAISGFYSMNVFEVAFWTAAFWLLIRIVNTGDSRLWIALGVLLGLGLMNKISVLVLGVGFAGGLLLTSHRRHLRSPHLWIGGAVAILIFLPHVIWQIATGWPTLEFIENAKRYKIAANSPLGFFTEQIMQMHPGFFPLWFAGLGYLIYSKRMASHRILGLVYVIAFIVMVAQSSKPYYLASAYVPLFAGGACALEQVTRSRLRWLRPVTLAYAAAFGVVTAPLVLPALPVDTLIRYQQTLGLTPSNAENSAVAELPQILADRFGWQEMTAAVASVYEQLPKSERAKCVIVTGNYGEAGAIQYYGRRYDLPPVASQHNSYYFWGFGVDAPEVVIAVGISEEDLRNAFDEVETAAVLDLKYAMPYERNRPIYIARKFKVPPEEAWAAGKHFI